MISQQHEQVVLLARDLSLLWAEQGQPVPRSLLEPADTAALASWAADCDSLEDVVIEASVAHTIASLAGAHPTSFCHFSLPGYCWDTDPYPEHWSELANLSVAEVEVRQLDWWLPGWQHPLEARIRQHGPQCWDDQRYPSAEEMAWHYVAYAIDAHRQGQLGTAWRCMGYAAHMLADLTIPHHRALTIGTDHPGYESWLSEVWGRDYADRSEARRRAVLVDERLEKHAKCLLPAQCADVEQLGRLIGGCATGTIGERPSREVTRRTMALAAVATIRLVQMYEAVMGNGRGHVTSGGEA